MGAADSSGPVREATKGGATPSIVRWSSAAQVQGGPAQSTSSSFLADAYSVVEVIATAGGDTTEAFQAGSIADLSLVMIRSSEYHPTDLTYTLGGQEVALDLPQLFVGAGMLSRFADPLSEITVTNNLADDVRVTVLVARSA